MSVPSASRALSLERPPPWHLSALRQFDRGRLLVVLVPLALLAAWSWLARSGVFPEQVMVSPSDVGNALARLAASGELWQATSVSLQRLALGYAAGAAVGLAFGVAMGLSNDFAGIVGPSYHALRLVPTIAFMPMLVLLFGVEEAFKVILIAKATFFPVSLAAGDAVRGMPRSYFEVARVCQLTAPVLVRSIVLPATVPPIVSGLRLALGRGWMILVAAEIVAADSGLGQLMEMGRQMMQIDVVMVGVCMTGGVGFLLDRGMRWLERRLLRWQAR